MAGKEEQAPVALDMNAEIPLRLYWPPLRATVDIDVKSLAQQIRDGDQDVLYEGRTRGAGLASEYDVFGARKAFAARVITDANISPKPDTSEPGWAEKALPAGFLVQVGAFLEQSLIGPPPEPEVPEEEGKNSDGS